MANRVNARISYAKISQHFAPEKIATPEALQGRMGIFFGGFSFHRLSKIWKILNLIIKLQSIVAPAQQNAQANSRRNNARV